MYGILICHRFTFRVPFRFGQFSIQSFVHFIIGFGLVSIVTHRCYPIQLEICTRLFFHCLHIMIWTENWNLMLNPTLQIITSVGCVNYVNKSWRILWYFDILWYDIIHFDFVSLVKLAPEFDKNIWLNMWKFDLNWINYHSIHGDGHQVQIYHLTIW